MKLDKVITLASSETRLDFTVMERSLRATGCDLPLQVIPYNDARFELPKNSCWLEAPEFYNWVERRCASPMMRKYLPLTMGNYQYCDSDLVFLEDPRTVLGDKEGFVVACTEWNKPQWTTCDESQAYLASKSSTWQQKVFCAGQYACDRPLHTRETLIAFAEQPANQAACLRFPLHDQPGTNLLVLSTDVPLTNLTLPPYRMESTMAIDYEGDYAHLWKMPGRKPYLMHYAGGRLDLDLPINELFFEFLTREERAEWEAQASVRRALAAKRGRWPSWAKVAKRLIPAIDKRFELSWNSRAAN
jgi:hypothetical protein